MSQKSDLVPLGALWKKEGKDFLSGKLGDANVFVFANKDKKNPKAPDFRICVGKPAPKKEAPSSDGFDF